MVKRVSADVARLLKIQATAYTAELAHVMFTYEALRGLRNKAPMRLGCTKRPNIHRDILLRDVARVVARFSGNCPIAELKKINFSREERAKNKRSKGLISKPPPVEEAARALLNLAGENCFASLRRPARNARGMLEADLLP